MTTKNVHERYVRNSQLGKFLLIPLTALMFSGGQTVRMVRINLRWLIFRRQDTVCCIPGIQADNQTYMGH